MNYGLLHLSLDTTRCEPIVRQLEKRTSLTAYSQGTHYQFSHGSSVHLGAGMIIDPLQLQQNLEQYQVQFGEEAQWSVSPHARLLLPYHRLLQSDEGLNPLQLSNQLLWNVFHDQYSFRFRDLLYLEKIQAYVVEALGKEQKKVAEKYFEKLGNIRNLLSHQQSFDEKKTLSDVLVTSKESWIQDVVFHQVQEKRPFTTALQSSLISTDLNLNQEITRIGLLKPYVTSFSPFDTITAPMDLAQAEKLHLPWESYAQQGVQLHFGWLDIHQLRQDVLRNQIRALILYDLTALDWLEEIAISPRYLSEKKPQLKRMAGWQKSTEGMKDFTQLPEMVKYFVATIEEAVEIPVMAVVPGEEWFER